MHTTGRRGAWWLAIVLLPIGLATANASPDPQVLRARVDVIAGQLTHFATHAIISNRPLQGFGIPSDLVAEQAKLFSDLKALGDSPDELHLLLRAPNPKVRTIVLGALFVREDPQDLPYLASLIGDNAASFTDLHDSLSAYALKFPDLPDSKSSPALSPPVLREEIEGPQTVGQVTRAMIHFYLDAVYLHSSGEKTREDAPAPELSQIFQHYWDQRKDRAHSASWFLVKLKRSTRNCIPLSPQYKSDVDSVLAQINVLPSPDREWVLLYAVFGEVFGQEEGVISEAALLHAAKAIGPAELMKFLLLEPISTDPDLRFTQADPRGEVLFPISAFILNHASQLLRPTDGPVLRANAFQNPQLFHGSAQEWIAASDWLLGIENPMVGAAQLQTDLALFLPSQRHWNDWEQIPLGVDLWKLRGASAKNFLIDWFYRLSPSQNPSPRQAFVRLIDLEARSDTPELFMAIIADPRFDSTNWSVLAQLLESAGGGISAALVPSKEIYSYMPNQFRSDQGVVFAAWRNVLRRHYGLPEHAVSGPH